MVRAITCNCGVLKGENLHKKNVNIVNTNCSIDYSVSPGFFLFLFKGKIINGSRKCQSKEGFNVRYKFLRPSVLIYSTLKGS